MIVRRDIAPSVPRSWNLIKPALRSRGAGLAAGFSKAGGVLIIALVALAVAPLSIAGTALMGAIPMGIVLLPPEGE